MVVQLSIAASELVLPLLGLYCRYWACIAVTGLSIYSNWLGDRPAVNINSFAVSIFKSHYTLRSAFTSEWSSKKLTTATLITKPVMHPCSFAIVYIFLAYYLLGQIKLKKENHWKESTPTEAPYTHYESKSERTGVQGPCLEISSKGEQNHYTTAITQHTCL